MPLVLFILSFATALAPMQPVQAQNLFAPVAKVNNSVVSAYELSQRMAFLTLLRAPGDIRELALRQLTNERLQLAAADQAGIELEDEKLAEGMSEFAGRANLDTERFLQIIAQGGIAPETFRDFVKAGMLWREVVRAKFASRVNITDAEIDRAIAKAEPSTEVRVLLSEIVLPANTPQSAAASTQRAAQLAKITSLTDFASAARRYSVAPSKGRSGRLDWINLSDLPPAVASQVVSLAPGQVTSPITARNGIAVFQLREIQEINTPAASDVNLDYASYYIPGGRSPAALAVASKIRDEIDTCDDLYGIAKNQPEEVLDRDTLPLAQVPTDIAMELARMDNNEVSTALTRNNGQTLVFLMLCGRSRALEEDISRDEIVLQLRNQRLAALANSYLADLRADAHIEILEP
ncbi:MAG TPA: peptidylprolyl isomerase [Aliiroseovarius sp.]|nr:peptidylprolyl isomerase [Aliiroseovarius sp.]